MRNMVMFGIGWSTLFLVFHVTLLIVGTAIPMVHVVGALIHAGFLAYWYFQWQRDRKRAAAFQRRWEKQFVWKEYE